MKNPGIWFNFCESIVTHDFRLAVWDVLPIPGEFHLEMISWHLGVLHQTDGGTTQGQQNGSCKQCINIQQKQDFHPGLRCRDKALLLFN